MSDAQPISDEALAAMRGRTGAWPKNSAECNALIARLDAAESKLAAAEARSDELYRLWEAMWTKATAAEAVIEAARRRKKIHDRGLAAGYGAGKAPGVAAIIRSDKDLYEALAAYDRALSTTPEDAE